MLRVCLLHGRPWITPLEVGILVIGFTFFVVPLLGSPRGVEVHTLWGAGVVTFLVGAFLVWGPGNFYLLYWTLPGVDTFSVGLITPQGYHPGGWTTGVAGVDFKFLTLILAALGGSLFVVRHNGITSMETLLIGLIAVVAGLLTFALDNLVLLYLGLELQALCLYTLIGFVKFKDERTDVALRYLLSGSLVSGFMLLGFARWYGLNGGLQVAEFIEWDYLGSTWVVGVLLFKVGVAPFHFWTPLVYTPLEWGTLGLTLGATKVNIWYLLGCTLRGALEAAWWPAWWAAILSLLVGSVGGFFQTNLGGLLAYSGVINGGYLVLLLLTHAPWVFGYYAGVYLFSTLALVGVAATWGDTRLTGLAVWTKLGVGVPLVVYYLTLNLGGLPVFPGFFAKLALLWGLSSFGFLTLAVVVALSIIPAVYYVSIAGGALFEPSQREAQLPGSTPYLGVVLVGLGLNGLWGLGLSLV